MSVDTVEKRYIISDAAKIIDVESHVLRYWEEELEIEIPRNEMQHRYYTDYYIELFKKVKELKENGFQLKAIKMLLPDLMSDKPDSNVDELIRKVGETTLSEKEEKTDEISQVGEIESQKTSDFGNKMEQFQMIISEAVSSALKDSTTSRGRDVSDMVSDHVIKEMDYMLQLKEQREEERFRKLDATIRSCQVNNKSKKKRGLIGKFKK